jgi:hypothetical protein
MNKYLVFIILISCFILLALPRPAAADDRGDRFFSQHENFRGHEQCYLHRVKLRERLFAGQR